MALQSGGGEAGGTDSSFGVSNNAGALPPGATHPGTQMLLPGTPDSLPRIREAVARATYEQLIGFQLTSEQLRYNATR